MFHLAAFNFVFGEVTISIGAYLSFFSKRRYFYAISSPPLC